MNDLLANLLHGAMQAAGREAVSGIAKSLFEKSSPNPGIAAPREGALSDNRDIYAKLSELSEHVTSLSQFRESLRSAVISEQNLRYLDEAYRYLESLRDIFDSETISIVQPDTVVTIVAHWRTLIDLEDRPDKLVLLPYWADLLTSLVGPAGKKQIAELFGRKYREVAASVADGPAEIEALAREAERLLAQYMFDWHEFSDRPPFIQWSVRDMSAYGFASRPHFGNPRHYAAFPVGRPGLWGTMGQERRLEEIRRQMVDLWSSIAPLIASHAVMQQYSASKSELPGTAGEVIPV